MINRASLALKETLVREGKPRTVDKDFCLFVPSILASLHYLSSKKKKKERKKKITFSPCHWSFHLLFVILTLKKTFSTWAFTLTG